MAFVIDASLAATWFLSDETSPATEALRSAASGGVTAPSLLKIEKLNVLVMANRRGRTSEDVLRQQVRLFMALPIVVRDPSVAEAIVDVALRRRLTAYDATYLALALELGSPLATLDKALAAAARLEGVEVIGPLRNRAAVS